MSYSLRKDVVLEKTDGVYVLIALRSAWKDCPFALTVIPVYAEIWSQLQEGKTEEDILQALAASHGFAYERAKSVFDKFIQAASSHHYILDDNDEAS